jgi:hypothetical protein
MRKALFKGFEIINNIMLRKVMTEKRRIVKKEMNPMALKLG